MQNYIGTKIIQAELMTANEFRRNTGRPELAENENGYMVRYPDGYESWSPEREFVAAYRLVRPEEMALLGFDDSAKEATGVTACGDSYTDSEPDGVSGD